MCGIVHSVDHEHPCKYVQGDSLRVALYADIRWSVYVTYWITVGTISVGVTRSSVVTSIDETADGGSNRTLLYTPALYGQPVVMKGLYNTRLLIASPEPGPEPDGPFAAPHQLVVASIRAVLYTPPPAAAVLPEMQLVYMVLLRLSLNSPPPLVVAVLLLTMLPVTCVIPVIEWMPPPLPCAVLPVMALLVTVRLPVF